MFLIVLLAAYLMLREVILFTEYIYEMVKEENRPYEEALKYEEDDECYQYLCEKTNNDESLKKADFKILDRWVNNRILRFENKEKLEITARKDEMIYNPDHCIYRGL